MAKSFTLRKERDATQERHINFEASREVPSGRCTAVSWRVSEHMDETHYCVGEAEKDTFEGGVVTDVMNGRIADGVKARS